MLQIKIKYIDKTIDKIEKIENGDWLDLRSSVDIAMVKGDFSLIPLGVAMELPKGYEAHMQPRSSTYKKFGIIQTNSTGIIDSSYCGDNDVWLFPAFALRNTTIHKNDKICQFRIVEKMPEVELIVVKKLNNKDRNGIGSTGTN